MFNAQNKHQTGLFPNVADNPVIAKTITPQPAKLMAQGLPKAARVFVRGNAGIHVVENFPLRRPVNGFQVFFDPWVVVNPPSQGSYAADWK